MAQNYGGLYECPHCGKIIGTIGPLMKHIKCCKKKLCEKCNDKDTCRYATDENWFIECPHNLKI